MPPWKSARRSGSASAARHALGYDDPGWKKRYFGIGPEWGDLPSSRAIHPLSPFAVCWVSTTAVFLLYTAVLTPPIIAFHWLEEVCVLPPTLEVDVMVDFFFLFDILLSFHVGYMSNETYHDDHGEIVQNYLRNSLLFDLVTSFPVSFFDLATIAACKGDASESADGTAFRFIRSLKPLRWFKIARIMKLGKGSMIASYLMDYFRISPRMGKTSTVILTLIAILHVTACLVWLFKVLTSSAEEVEEFMDRLPWGEHGRQPLNTDAGKIDAYVVSVYFHHHCHYNRGVRRHHGVRECVYAQTHTHTHTRTRTHTACCAHPEREHARTRTPEGL